MELLVNDLSLAGQFSSIHLFSIAVETLMKMRAVARAFGRELRCHRNLSNCQVTNTLNVQQAVQLLSREQRQAFMQWIGKHGPFWDDDRIHTGSDYLDADDVIVTDTALGEAAFGILHGIDRNVTSLMPSQFEHTPVSVRWCPDAGEQKLVKVPNYWDVEALEAALKASPEPIRSWGQTFDMARARFPNLSFAPNCFDELRPHPFVDSAARQILILLDVMNRLKDCFGADGQRTAEGHRLYQEHFTGVKAWFSDSSDTEKNEFMKELTFLDPRTDQRNLFCPWHGKIKTPQIRIHFSSPVRAAEPLYVVYVGPKLTKR